jgi:peptidoglycan/LPS O-acetylase OafA/YrhL
LPPSPHVPAASPPASDNIPALTGFRGFAAMIVVLNHAGQFGGQPEFLPVRHGYFGVHCFFCLSGALFALLYFDGAGTRPAFLSRFYLARLIRIFPVYWLILAVYALSASPVEWSALGWHAIMGHGFFHAYRDAINTPMWTLPVECGFYLLVPWIFVAMRTLRQRWAAPDAAARSWHWTHAVSLLVFSGALGLIGAALHRLDPTDPDWWKGTIFGRFSQFGLGVATGLFLADVRSGAVRLPRAAGNWIAIAAFGLLVTQVTILEVIDKLMAPGSLRWLYFGAKLSFAVTACLLIVAAFCGSIWQRFLASRPLVYLGVISYTLYLLQCASVGPVKNLSADSARFFQGLGFGSWPTVALTMAVCCGVAVVVHHAFDSPVQRWLRRRLLPRTVE